MSFHRIHNYKSQRKPIDSQSKTNNSSQTSQILPFHLHNTHNHSYYISSTDQIFSQQKCSKSLANHFDNSKIVSSKCPSLNLQNQPIKRNTNKFNDKKKSLKQINQQSPFIQQIIEINQINPKEKAYSLLKKSINKDLVDFIKAAEQIQAKIDNNAQIINLQQMIKIHNFRKKLKQQMMDLDQFITDIIDQDQTKNTILIDSEEQQKQLNQ